MNSRYLCKAKRTDSGEWVEGYYFCMMHDDGRHAHHFIIPLGTDLSLGTPIEKIQVEVDPATICQRTGRNDEWEHDIFVCEEYVYEILYCEDSLSWIAASVFGSDSMDLGEFYQKDYTRIGNAIDNPELLEVEE